MLRLRTPRALIALMGAGAVLLLHIISEVFIAEFRSSLHRVSNSFRFLIKDYDKRNSVK